MLIVFDGIDGAGKSTHLKIISKWLKKKQIEHITAREPGGTDLAEKIREIFISQPMDPMIQLMLLSAARFDLTKHWKDAKESLILCDRFIDSTYAYQGDAIDYHIIDRFIQMSAHIKPDFTFVFLTPQKEKSLNYMDEVGKKNRIDIIKRFKKRIALQPKKYFIVPNLPIYEQNYLIKRKLKTLLSIMHTTQR